MIVSLFFCCFVSRLFSDSSDKFLRGAGARCNREGLHSITSGGGAESRGLSPERAAAAVICWAKFRPMLGSVDVYMEIMVYRRVRGESRRYTEK